MPVRGYEGVYEVSDLGRVRRVRPASGTRPGCVLKPARRPDGRLKVTLSCKSAVRNFKVHVLVARAFLGPPPPGCEVNHKDGDPSNNRLDNLEYMTAQENSLHAKRVLRKGAGSNHCFAKLDEEAVGVILASGEGCRALARRFGVSQSTIRDVRKGRTWATATCR